MANPDGNPNPNIVEAGKATRFGQERGADPREAAAKATAPASIRNAMRRLMAREIDMDKDVSAQMTPEARMRYLAGPQKKLTEAMVMALAATTQAAKNPKAMANYIDQVDGKLIEKQVQATVPFSELVKESLDDDLQSGE